jgi:AraC-like DNA-binding protein
MAVEEVLKANAISYHSVELGVAKLSAPLTAVQKETVSKGLAHYHLSLMEGRNKILVERIKKEITGILHAEEPLRFKLSAHLSQALDYNYTYLANMFSEEEGITLERYFIQQRVERVKELIVYEDLSLAQITDQLNYSSV